MGDQVARVILTILYFTLVLPFGIGSRLLLDPLGRHSTPEWTEKEMPEASLDQAGNLF